MVIFFPFFFPGYVEIKEEVLDDEDEGGEPAASAAAKSESELSSPFKKPSLRASVSGSISEDLSESGGSRFSVESALKAKKAQLSYYKTPRVGRETVCVFCLEKCADKDPKLLTCLHSTCAQCFRVREKWIGFLKGQKVT